MESRDEQEIPSRCSQTLLPGNVLGSYRIIELLGEGAMGRVYHAEHVRLGRGVALKVLNEEYAGKRELVRRFFSEARAANQIDHENIVEITDFVEDNACGLYFLVMERLQGIDLLDLISRSGAIPPLRAVNIGRQLASALAAAHKVGIIHRDLKPENIYLSERTGRKDFVKILDFGVAKLIEDEDYSPFGISLHETSPGSMIGTPMYMSPEQACGREVDHRSDIYALGVILYEMVAGKVPFEGISFGELVVKHTVMTPPRPSQREDLTYPIPQALEDLILKCLEKDPERRFQSMEAIRDELGSISKSLSSQPDPAASPSAPAHLPIADDDTRAEVEETSAASEESGGGPLEPIVEDGSEGAVESETSEDRALAVSGPRRSLLLAAAIGVCLIIALWAGYAAVDSQQRHGPPADGPAPSIPTPREHTITVESQPDGAEVWDVTEGALIGETPLVKRFSRDERSHVFELRKEGFSPTKRTLKLDRDIHLAVTMAELSPEPTPRPVRAADAAPEATDAASSDEERSVVKSGSDEDRPRSARGRRDATRESGEGSSPAPASKTEISGSRRGVLDPFADPSI